MTKDVDSQFEGVSIAAEEIASLAARSAQPAASGQPAEVDSAHSKVVINIRFSPDGLVCSATYRPEHMSPQVWFDHVCRMAPEAYMPLSGGRGSFCIGREEFAVISAAADKLV
jgi:hypothetical protein